MFMGVARHQVAKIREGLFQALLHARMMCLLGAGFVYVDIRAEMDGGG